MDPRRRNPSRACRQTPLLTQDQREQIIDATDSSSDESSSFNGSNAASSETNSESDIESSDYESSDFTEDSTMPDESDSEDLMDLVDTDSD